MGYFKRELHQASDTGDWYYIYHPSIFKKGTVYVKGKDAPFVKRLKGKPKTK